MAHDPNAGRPLSAAQRELLTRTLDVEGPRLLAYLRRAWGEQEAEDLFEETFLRAAQRIDAVTNAQRPGLYLLTIARNLARDRLRRPAPQAVESNELDACAATPSMGSEGEASIRLRAAVTRLPEPLREVVALRLAAELKFEEIAELLGIPLGTALTRMRSAVTELRGMLEASAQRVE